MMGLLQNKQVIDLRYQANEQGIFESTIVILQQFLFEGIANI